MIERTRFPPPHISAVVAVADFLRRHGLVLGPGESGLWHCILWWLRADVLREGRPVPPELVGLRFEMRSGRPWSPLIEEALSRMQEYGATGFPTISGLWFTDEMREALRRHGKKILRRLTNELAG